MAQTEVELRYRQMPSQEGACLDLVLPCMVYTLGHTLRDGDTLNLQTNPESERSPVKMELTRASNHILCRIHASGQSVVNLVEDRWKCEIDSLKLVPPNSEKIAANTARANYTNIKQEVEDSGEYDNKATKPVIASPRKGRSEAQSPPDTSNMGDSVRSDLGLRDCTVSLKPLDMHAEDIETEQSSPKEMNKRKAKKLKTKGVRTTLLGDIDASIAATLASVSTEIGIPQVKKDPEVVNSNTTPDALEMESEPEPEDWFNPMDDSEDEYGPVLKKRKTSCRLTEEDEWEDMGTSTFDDEPEYSPQKKERKITKKKKAIDPRKMVLEENGMGDNSGLEQKKLKKVRKKKKVPTATLR